MKAASLAGYLASMEPISIFARVRERGSEEVGAREAGGTLLARLTCVLESNEKPVQEGAYASIMEVTGTFCSSLSETKKKKERLLLLLSMVFLQIVGLLGG